MSAARPEGFFITGTDTGVGKTLVSAGLSLYLRQQGIDVGVMKPAETGVSDCAAAGPDAELLRWAADSRDELDDISPYRFKAPLAPAVAASREQVRINYSELAKRAAGLIKRHQFTLVEGAGGLMVPLAGGLLMADLARALGLPLLLVVRPGLGTINHTLLTQVSARAMEIPVAGYLINRMPAEQGLAEETAAHSLASLTTEDLLGVLPEVTGSDREKAAQLAAELAELPTLPLWRPYLPR
jgi:dethiobiotin synthetase